MNQPRPFEPLCRRWVARLKFPPYRHLPGETPHPRIHPEGHSYGVTEPLGEKPLSSAAWWENEAYLFGVDLYNYAYWWEAHEQWEAAWKQAEGDTAHLLQGMIQLGAALIKWNLGNDRGREGLWSRSHQHLHQIVSPQWCGVCIRPLAEEAGRFFNHHPRAPLRGWLEGPVLQLETLPTR